MEKRTKVAITFSALVFMVFILYIFTDWFSQVTGYFLGESETAKLAECLKGKSEYYGTSNCAECEQQQKIFGQAFELINYVDCGENKINCPNIQSIPAWYIDKQIYYGFKSIDELKEISGCG